MTSNPVQSLLSGRIGPGAVKGQEAKMLAAYRLAALKAPEDVENALYSLARRQEQVAVLASRVDSLGRARAASFSAYQKGVVSLIEVQHADETLLQATEARVQAQTESARSAVAIFKALGGGRQIYTQQRLPGTRRPTIRASRPAREQPFVVHFANGGNQPEAVFYGFEA